MKLYGPNLPARSVNEDTTKVVKKLLLEIFGIHVNISGIKHSYRASPQNQAPIIVRYVIFFSYL